MKGLLLTALSLCLLTASYAQDGDDDGILNEKIAHDGSPMPGHHMHLDRHWCDYTTIALSPLQYTENGIGFGLSYERALDPDGIISIYVPFIATFSLKNNNYSYSSYGPYGGYDPTMNNNNSANLMLYAMPGVKFYPSGMGRVKYAIGPSAVVGWGQKAYDGYDNYYTYDPNFTAPMYTYGVYDRMLLGMMVNNSLNINPTPHLYIGLEMGFGFTYYDKIGNYNRGTTFLTQGAFKMGYTF